METHGIQMSRSWVSSRFDYMDCLIYDYGISSALATEMLQSCTEPFTYMHVYIDGLVQERSNSIS